MKWAENCREEKPWPVWDEILERSERLQRGGAIDIYREDSARNNTIGREWLEMYKY